eukprot:CAMPEP_0206043834 /NCGR_PEP_ID=MMETSP1466-20131121/10357_1 /ASSEMBLY_ACC=CAM_ASM_001126 /TAXON_ID=44452 /ORGANISM="Pavlova gyrans, Strain CCMP608" /LENGTH=103 /DNA_ID=CAMNT_0053418697 /DNA_START=20 /DNA_END=331 /DNA_ORIENTATION=+
MAPTMFVTVEIKEDMIDEFLEVMKEDVDGSMNRENGGCLTFYVHRDIEQKNKFYFYEMYKDAGAAAAHKETPHYKKWAAFKEKGGVLSQAVSKMDMLMGGHGP